MRALALALLAIAATAPSSDAATVYWAFGDSVTRGEGGNFVLDPVAGNDCTALPYPVSKCGYHWRLANSLAAAGIANTVYNRGKAAESTSMGKSRIDDPGEPLEFSRCTDPNAGDVVLIKEGTNDISNSVPTADVKIFLGEIVDLATTKCVHSALASTIRRLLAGTGTGSTLGDPEHSQTSDLATKVSALASEKNRAYVNVWGALCPAQACYDARFWGRLVPADPGHVKPAGYDTMAPLFQAAIVGTPAAGAATLVGPAGDVTSKTPAFCWNAHPNSDWYFLEVDGGASYGRWHPEKAVFPGGPCAFAPVPALADGPHTWRVRTRNLRGVGAWSATSSFTIWSTAPGATTSVAPDNASYFASPPFNPTYSWNAAANAMNYRLQVNSGAAVDAIYAGSAVCSGSNCAATPASGLGTGSYTWRVRAENPAGDGAWSAVKPFTVSCPLPAVKNLEGATESGPKAVDACTEIIAGDLGPYTIAAPLGNVTFHAGAKITFHDGFTVEANAAFTAIVDQ